MTQPISALALFVGFEMRRYDRHDVSRWVDAEVEKTDVPTGVLLELTTLRDKHDVDIVNLLRELSGELDEATVARQELRTLRAQVLERRILLREAVGLAWHLSYRLSREADLEACQIDDDYELAVSGAYGTIAEVEARFLAFLDEHGGPLGSHR